jgi:hypothetical protein
MFWEVMSLERGPLSLLSIPEELLGRNSSGSGLESQEYGRRDLLCSSCNTLYLQKMALTSPTSGGWPVIIVCSQTRLWVLFCFLHSVSVNVARFWVTVALAWFT